MIVFDRVLGLNMLPWVMYVFCVGVIKSDNDFPLMLCVVWPDFVRCRVCPIYHLSCDLISI